MVVELIRNLTTAGATQVVATTHSPIVLQWLKEDEFRHVFLFRRDEKTGASTVQPLSAKPEAVEALHKYSISDLMTEAWLEEVL